ncbi:MAG: GPR endopeptidase [Firmicutes bacterium]|nr:GPR endopeptidase [Bacillota bacterium]
MSTEFKSSGGYIPTYNIRTDLALEAQEVIREKTAAEIPGVTTKTIQEDGVTVSRVKIETPEAASRLGKAPGSYITLEAPGLRRKDSELQDRACDLLTRELLHMLPLSEQLQQTVLVVGLGNWNITPDALGPRVVEDLLVTRHFFELKNPVLGEGFRSVCALSPGVLGITGIETGEIILSLIPRIQPGLVIVIDALAAHRLERLHTTIQIADTGVTPGSGVGNRRLSITRETIGVPVIAIGIPTVVDASTIINDTMDVLVGNFKKKTETMAIGNTLEKLEPDRRLQLIREVLRPYVGNLMVTPKEIDTFIEDMAMTVAGGLNAALHPRVQSEEPEKYLQ